MNIYLASSFSRQEEMRTYAAALRESGHVVTSRWLTDENHPFWQGEMVLDVAAQCARKDWDDVIAADIVAVFTDGSDKVKPGGGRHVELGFALAYGKEVIVVGPREHVFHSLPQVTVLNDFDDLLTYLSDTEW